MKTDAGEVYQFKMEETRLADLNTKLLKFGERENLKPEELTIVLKLFIEFMENELGLSVERMSRN